MQNPSQPNDNREPLDLPSASQVPQLPQHESGFSLKSPNHKPKLTNKQKLLLVGAGIVALVVMLFVAVLGWLYVQWQPRDADGASRRVSIVSGMGPDEIAETLQSEGIVKNATAFRAYLRIKDVENQLIAGTYVLSPAQSVAEVTEHLVEGKIDALQITIVPGLTQKEIKQVLLDYGYTNDAIDTAFSRTYDHPLFASKPAGQGLEGYIFPDTYEIQGDDSVEDLLTKVFDNFYEKIQESNINALLGQYNLSLYQAITLASIIQEEVPTPEEQRQVSQVFHKRLNQDMALESDPTFKYAAELMGVEPRVRLDSPYNTRVNKGLPPGPIANFNISALEAVANPADADYLYFVAGDDGVTHFSYTLDEHEEKTRKYCTELCQ